MVALGLGASHEETFQRDGRYKQAKTRCRAEARRYETISHTIRSGGLRHRVERENQKSRRGRRRYKKRELAPAFAIAISQQRAQPVAPLRRLRRGVARLIGFARMA
jgi:hypothetical protein